MIRSEKPSDKEAVEALTARLENNWKYTVNLRKSNAQNMDMSLVYSSDNGDISGYVCCADGLCKDVKCIFLAGIFAESEEIFSALIDELKNLSAQKGYDVIFALDHCTELYNNYGFTDAMKNALCPPDRNDGLNKLEFCIYRLGESNEPFFRFAEYPEALGIDYCMPRYAFRSVITAEEMPKYAYKTRFFSRLALHAPFIIVSVIALVMLITNGDSKYIRFLIASLIMLGVSISRPIRFTLKYAKKLKKKNDADEDKWLYFYDSHLVCANLKKGGGSYYYYKDYPYIYMKRDYIFIGRKNGENMDGIYVSTKSLENNAQFREFLKSRCPDTKIRF